MSTSSVPLFTIITQQVTIYLGLPLLILGLFGGLLNIIVFLSLKTFRQSSSAFYLTAMSFANIAHLLFSLLPYIFIVGYGIDWSSSSMIFCKLRFYCIQLWLLTSFTCMCLATIDQFLATCFNPSWHRWSHIKYARYILTGCFIVWLFHGIPSAIYYNLTISPMISNGTVCLITNVIFQQYSIFGYVLVLMGILPLLIMVTFGLLAYHNVRNLAYRTVPLVRRELDKQITQMVLVQVIYNFVVISPFVIATLLVLIIPNNGTIISIQALAIIVHNFYFASPFYIYLCVSKRFRQQLQHVFCIIHYNRWRDRNINNNQVVPQLPGTSINNN